MAKLGKNYYRTANGEKKLNCYMIPLAKEIISKTDISEEDELKISVKENKIIVEKKR